MSLVDTKSTFQNNPNNASLNAPDNMSDFMDQAKSFVQKAQSQGLDNTAIANTIRFMYTLTQQNITNKEAQTNTPAQQTAGEVSQGQLGVAQAAEARLGKGQLVLDPNTQQYVNTLPGAPGDPLVPGNNPANPPVSQEFSQAPAPASTAPNTSTATGTKTNSFDPAAFDQAWNPTTPTKKISSSPNTSIPNGQVFTPPPMTNGQMAQYNPSSWQAQVANSNPFAAMIPKLS